MNVQGTRERILDTAFRLAARDGLEGLSLAGLASELGMSKSEWSEVWLSSTPMGRLAEPQEIAPAVLYLASDAASFATGTNLVVDGGYTSW